MRDILGKLGTWVASGGREVGQVAVQRGADGFVLCHQEDAGRAGLREFAGAQAALELAHFDDAGRFRPLKTAPNLQHGWRLRLADLTELRRALDYFYPAMLGLWCSFERGELQPATLRETLGRQSGMYRVAREISDAQAQALIGGFCRSEGGCLKHPLWEICPGQPIATLPPEKLQAPNPLPGWPLLCHEACNLLVAEARKVVKQAAP